MSFQKVMYPSVAKDGARGFKCSRKVAVRWYIASLVIRSRGVTTAQHKRSSSLDNLESRPVAFSISPRESRTGPTLSMSKFSVFEIGEGLGGRAVDEFVDAWLATEHLTSMVEMFFLELASLEARGRKYDV
ncbi:hypothetical protein E4U42_007223 [Claviceps africana]|uniref:Uncharacterized protein n=1 Tax=Claviceps africana TaxID=83212 RepID=A0A8K0NNM6_9HYPO|nr:hypothetical protein E4U42_007223 [Claviceps africana]